MPDIDLGRIPVDTNGDLAAIVSKITSYENSAFGSWKENITFVTDDVPDPAGNFINLAEGLITEFIDPDPNYHAIRLYQNDFGCFAPGSSQCNRLTRAITETMNITGTLMVNYIGHASIEFWSQQKILQTSNLDPDIPSLNNFTKPVVLLSMTCLDGFWQYPNRPSIVHEMINHPNGGAVGTYSATGLGVATGHDSIQHGFFESLFTDGDWNFGTAATTGKIELFASGVNFDLMHTFSVFGDPAMGIGNPYDVNMTPGASGQSANVGATANYNLTVQNTGDHPDTFDISIGLTDWTTTASTMTVGPLNPGQTAPVSIMVQVPAGAIDNDQDVAVVTATSRGDTAKTDVTTLTTTAISNWIYVTPPGTTIFGSPGQVVEFELTATNTSPATRSYDISFTGNTWTTSLSTATIGPLSSGASTTFSVFVTIPGGATAGQFDDVDVTVTAQTNPGKSETVQLRTIVSGGNAIYLPIIMRE